MELLPLSRLNLEYAVFCTACLGLFAFLHAGLWRRRLKCWMAVAAWVGLALVLAAGKVAVHWAHERQWRQMEALAEGYAPTYAREMELHRHARVSLNTPPEDPTYRELLAAQHTWLERNPSIANIYTIRRDAVSGALRTIVDSATDTDRDGHLDSPAEQTIPIGTQLASMPPEIDYVLQTGQPAFHRPEEDTAVGPLQPTRWVSAYAAIRDEQGQVEAVLGVDFDAATWFKSLRMARYTMMCFTGFLVLTLSGLFSLLAVFALSDENRRRRRETQSERESRRKFSTLVNSIDGVVYEWDPQRGHFDFVSGQITRILGYAASAFTSDAAFWRTKLHPEDVESVAAARAETVRTAQPCRVEYRMKAAGGTMIWLREIGTPCTDEAGRVALIRGVLLDITAQREAAAELERLHTQLVDSSRRAGMAEVATGVLHNVGNVLNSVNVSAGIIRERLRESRLPNLTKLSEILHREESDLAAFLTTSERGRLVPRYLDQLATHLASERQSILMETENLLRGMEHIRAIVGAQQRHARTGGSFEKLNAVEIAREARRLAADELQQHGITLVEQFSRVPGLMADRHRLLQILVNVLQNAAQAVAGNAPGLPRTVTLAVRRAGRQRLSFVISDSGIGIESSHLASIFTRGFTTRRDGHGFGLHDSALAAQEMGGCLTAASHGPGMGAVFTLTLPAPLSPRHRAHAANSAPARQISNPTPPAAHAQS